MNEQQPGTAPTLARENRELAARVARQAETLETLRQRLALAEKSARDAWAFAKALRGSRSS